MQTLQGHPIGAFVPRVARDVAHIVELGGHAYISRR